MVSSRLYLKASLSIYIVRRHALSWTSKIIANLLYLTEFLKVFNVVYHTPSIKISNRFLFRMPCVDRRDDQKIKGRVYMAVVNNLREIKIPKTDSS